MLFFFSSRFATRMRVPFSFVASDYKIAMEDELFSISSLHCIIFRLSSSLSSAFSLAFIMASRFGRSFYRFSSVNRPVNPPPATSSGEYEGRQLPSAAATRYQPQPAEPTSPRRPRSPPYSPTRESLPPSPTYSAKKLPASPPLSPPYRATTSPPKPAAESPKYREATQPRSPPEADQKPVIYKTVEKPAKSDRYLDSAKSPPHKQQPNRITIAGENLGAVMEIVHSPNKREGGAVVKKKETRGTHHAGSENADEASKDKGGQSGKEASSLPTSTFMNSNFQSVNNSLLYDASLAQHDPGLHLCFSRKPSGHGYTVDEKKH